MPSILDQLEQKAARDENAGLAIAAKEATWANQFNSIPDPEKLRANLNLTQLQNNALRRKQELLAQTDLKAQELLHREKKFEQWQKDAPLRTELLQKRVETEGAHERFAQQKDAEAMADVAGFFETVAKITAKPGSPEYQAGLNAAVQRHPRVIGTQAGAAALKNLQREHQDVAAITPPEGMEIDRIDVGDDGRAKAVFKPIQPTVALPTNLVPSGATVNKRGDVSVNYSAPKDKADENEIKFLERQRELYTREFGKARDRRDRAKARGDQDLINAADEDVREYEAKRDEAESQLRSFREGNAGTPPTPSAPAKIASAEDFAKLPSGAEFIDPQGVKRRKP